MKNQKGITLIALIITIIVMMILVAVSVNIALGNGLFKAAQDAAKSTKTELENDTKLSNGAVTVDGKDYPTLNDYISNLNGTSPKKEMITFKIEGQTVQVEKGSTWEEAMSSINEQLGTITCYTCGAKLVDCYLKVENGSVMSNGTAKYDNPYGDYSEACPGHVNWMHEATLVELNKLPEFNAEASTSEIIEGREYQMLV